MTSSILNKLLSAVLEADSVEASEDAASQAVGNTCKTPEYNVRPAYPSKHFYMSTGHFQNSTLPVEGLQRLVRNKSRNKGKKPGMLVYFKLFP